MLDIGLGLRARPAAGGSEAPDANTRFLSFFNTATPIDLVRGVSGTLVGNASCDTGAGELVLDGTGDWVTFDGHANFDPSALWTVEWHGTIAAAQLGGVVSRTGTDSASRWAVYLPGDSRFHFYGGVWDGLETIISGLGAMDGTRKHYAVCRDAGNMWRLYVDGVHVNQRVHTVIPSASLNPLYIGTDIMDPTNRDIAGRIGRLKISNVCRYPDGTAFTPPAITDL
jgi:hypothetical protein